MCPLILITWEFMGAKHDIVKKRAKGRLRGKVYSSIRVQTASTTMDICKVRE
jgi:hypothetical protein